MVRATDSESTATGANAAFELGDRCVLPGTRVRFDLPVAELPTQTQIGLPVVVANGRRAGPRLWLSAAIHGDEIMGLEVVRQVLERISLRHLSGTLVAVPIVNVFGFLEQSRYLPDRRDLNRSFPGSPRGSLAGRLAHRFLQEIAGRCTHGIDLHTATDSRLNWPHLRANLDDPETLRCARAFGAPLLVHAATRDGSLRQAAAQRGIPVLVYEAGEALRFDEAAVTVGVAGVLRVMGALGMQPGPKLPLPDRLPLESRSSKWVRASRGGLFRCGVRVGQAVELGQSLGWIGDAFGERRMKVRAPLAGMVVSLRQNPSVNQGDGIAHLAVLSGEGGP